MKNIVITGAGRGIGLALTRQFLKNGNRIHATYRDEKSARELLDMASASKGFLSTTTLDVAEERSFGEFEKALAKLGGVDILVNNAGVIGGRTSSLLELDLVEVAKVFQVNTFGPMRSTRATLPYLNPRAVIASITSLMGSITDNESGGYYDYRMSKTALNMFNKSLSKEFPEFTCLVLHPGWVATDMGGPGAPVTPEASARGLHEIIAGAGTHLSGKFYDFTGKELPW